MNQISFNQVVDYGELAGYQDIFYITSNGDRLNFEQWFKIDFNTLISEGYFELND